MCVLLTSVGCNVERAAYPSGADHPTIYSSNPWTSEESEWKKQRALRLCREQAFQFAMGIATAFTPIDGFSCFLMLTANRERVKLLLLINRSHMEKQKKEVLPDTLNLMALNSITGAGRKRLAVEEGAWRRISIMIRALEPLGGSL